MPRHITRLVALMVAVGVAAYAARRLLTADSFYLYGHYRGASVAEIAADKPKFTGSEYCRDCHAERFAEWSKGVHHAAERGKAVQCEVCHGAAGAREAGGLFEHVSTGIDHPASGKLAIPPDSRRLCSLCHEKMPGRPAAQPQIVVATHAGAQQCTSCHNPHSPKMIRTAAAPAGRSTDATASKVASCSGCHGANGVSANPAWPNLAGQQRAYLSDALKAYKTGARDNAMMSATAKALSDGDISKIAGYYARLARPRSEAKGVANQANVTACVPCHGAAGISANPAWPNLAGQSKQYIVAALKAYKTGARKNELMAGVAGGLSDDEMNALAAHYAGAN